MNYPGRLIKTGEQDAKVVAAIVAELTRRGYPVAPGAAYDAKLKAVVSLFQSQHVDAAARPLLADGMVGPMTWAALFGAKPVAAPAKGLAAAALAHAVSQIGVMEQPLGSNSGKEVDAYLRAVNLAPGSYWCMAFVHYCFQQAATAQGTASTFPPTGGCLDAWRQVKKNAPGRIITAAQAIANPNLVRPGLVFVLDHGGGLGHTGFVRQSIGGALRTVEGNSNPDGSDNGIGVFDLNRRKVTEPQLLGFLDFTT